MDLSKFNTGRTQTRLCKKYGCVVNGDSPFCKRCQFYYPSESIVILAEQFQRFLFTQKSLWKTIGERFKFAELPEPLKFMQKDQLDEIDKLLNHLSLSNHV